MADAPPPADRNLRLAAEYTLGTLPVRAWPRLDGIAAGDAGVAAALRSWESRLAVLAEGAPQVTPPPRVWAGIAQRLGLGAAGAPPESLGVIPDSGVGRVALPAPPDIALADVPALAVSLEPAGGSPTGAPTGPVLYTGKVERFY
jgi:anti-sigma-K factor RskA